MQLTETFKTTPRTFSFEVFPAKTPEGHAKLLDTLKQLCALRPDYISCTYGAGGGNRDKTFEIVEHIQKELGVASMAHLTCVMHTRAEIEAVFDDFERRGITNILALRGDPPRGLAPGEYREGDLKYSAELVRAIRARFGEHATIGVAGFPEKHPLAPDFDSDARYLKSKIDAGADFVITQLFFNNQAYFDYVARLRAIGVTARIIPGVLPVIDYEGLKRFCNLCGAIITDEIHEIFAPIAGDKEKTLAQGIAFAKRQCRELLEGGAPGIHFYALNKVHPADVLIEAAREVAAGL